MRRAKAFTLVEVLVASVLALLLLGLLMSFFITALRRTNDGRIRVDLQQQAVIALNRWENDIGQTSARAMVIKSTGSPCVSFSTAIENSGSFIWPVDPPDDKLHPPPVIVSWFYDKDKKVLVRETYPREDYKPSGPSPFVGDPSPSDPYLPSSSEQDKLIQESSGAEKIMSRDVESFSITDYNGGYSAYVQPLRFELRLRRALSTPNQYAEFSIQKRYTLRNHF